MGSAGFEAAETEGIAVAGIEILFRPPVLFYCAYPKPG